jgi:hypothetical protein
MEHFLSGGLWKAIRQATNAARRVHAAIAYVHDVSHLRLREGDVLVCDASGAAVGGGQTSVLALKALSKKKVRLYSIAGLHAKVLVADETVFIGSANASLNSIEERLVEAGLRSLSPTVLAGALAFIHQLLESPEVTLLTPARLRALAKIRVKRRPISDRQLPKRKGQSIVTDSAAWIISVEDLTAKEAAGDAAVVKRATKKIIEEFGVSDPSWIRWDGSNRIRRELHGGSRIIVLHRTKGRALPYEITPPSALLRREESDDGVSTLFFYDPELSTPKTYTHWKTFKTLISKSGLRRKIYADSVVEISSNVMDELDRLWPRSRASRKH